MSEKKIYLFAEPLPTEAVIFHRKTTMIEWWRKRQVERRKTHLYSWRIGLNVSQSGKPRPDMTLDEDINERVPL